jgi:restriction system protein
MARRRKGAADDLVELVALLPWWAGVLLALVLYALLHRMAVAPLPTSVAPGQVGDMVGRSIWRALAGAGQYLLPFLCLAGAVASAWGRGRRKALLRDVEQAGAASAIEHMRWREFEMLVGESFRLQGYRVQETGGNGADGGVDLEMWRGNERFLVQCKHWKAFKVGVGVVRELYGVMAARGATGGFVVTSGRFSGDAAEFAGGRNIELIDGPKLQERLQRARKAGGSARSAQGRMPEAARRVDPIPSVPPCPVCSRPMARRTAKRGASRGEAFWGCTAYPSCRGTRPIG